MNALFTVIDSFSGDYKFLSNFYPCEIYYEGIIYPSVEHAYQAAKSNSPIVRQIIALIDTPGKAKRAGKKLEIRDDWEYIKNDVMMDLVICKFTNHKDLGKLLISTSPNELVKGNYWGDTYWGVCNGIGKNVLGKILMQVRSKLQQD